VSPLRGEKPQNRLLMQYRPFLVVVVTFKPTMNIETFKRQNSVVKSWHLIGAPDCWRGHGTTVTMVNPALLALRLSSAVRMADLLCADEWLTKSGKNTQ